MDQHQKLQRQPFFEVGVTRKAISTFIAFFVAIGITSLTRWALTALADDPSTNPGDSSVIPMLMWLAYGYLQVRIIFERHTRAVLCILAASSLLLLCLSAYMVNYDPVSDVNVKIANEMPSWVHPLGTDFVGRDMVMQLVTGTKGFFLPGLLASLIALLLGVSLGGFAGYVGGRVDSAITFLTTLIGSFPRLVFILLVVTINDEPNMFLIGSLVGVLFIPQVAEAIRRRVLSLKEEDFIIASRAHGLSLNRILFYHIVWLQCFPELVRQGLYLFVYVIFVETALSYLQLSTMTFEDASWGKMLIDATDEMVRGNYWNALVPTAAIVFATLGATALGDVVVGQAKQERL